MSNSCKKVLRIVKNSARIEYYFERCAMFVGVRLVICSVESNTSVPSVVSISTAAVTSFFDGYRLSSATKLLCSGT